MAEAVHACLVSWGALVAIWAVVVFIGVGPWRINRCDRRRWALQAQLRQVEGGVCEERLPDEEQGWRRWSPEKPAELRGEARRRLGWPEAEERRGAGGCGKGGASGRGLDRINGGGVDR